MQKLQRGFTVLEAVVAFAILSIVTVTTISVVTQNSIRSARLADTQATYEAAENIVSEIMIRLVTKTSNINAFSGVTEAGRKWKASVNPVVSNKREGKSQVLPLLKLDITIFGSDNRPELEFTTIMPGK